MSENIENTQGGEVRDVPQEQGESRRLDDVTTAPESHVERSRDYQEAEAIEQQLTQTVDSALESVSGAAQAVVETPASESRESSSGEGAGIAEGIRAPEGADVIPINLPDGEMPAGQEAAADVGEGVQPEVSGGFVDVMPIPIPGAEEVDQPAMERTDGQQSAAEGIRAPEGADVIPINLPDGETPAGQEATADVGEGVQPEVSGGLVDVMPIPIPGAEEVDRAGLPTSEVNGAGAGAGVELQPDQATATMQNDAEIHDKPLPEQAVPGSGKVVPGSDMPGGGMPGGDMPGSGMPGGGIPGGGIPGGGIPGGGMPGGGMPGGGIPGGGMPGGGMPGGDMPGSGVPGGGMPGGGMPGSGIPGGGMPGGDMPGSGMPGGGMPGGGMPGGGMPGGGMPGGGMPGGDMPGSGVPGGGMPGGGMPGGDMPGSGMPGGGMPGGDLPGGGISGGGPDSGPAGDAGGGYNSGDAPQGTVGGGGMDGFGGFGPGGGGEVGGSGGGGEKGGTTVTRLPTSDDWTEGLSVETLKAWLEAYDTVSEWNNMTEQADQLLHAENPHVPGVYNVPDPGPIEFEDPPGPPDGESGGSGEGGGSGGDDDDSEGEGSGSGGAADTQHPDGDQEGSSPGQARAEVVSSGLNPDKTGEIITDPAGPGLGGGRDLSGGINMEASGDQVSMPVEDGGGGGTVSGGMKAGAEQITDPAEINQDAQNDAGIQKT